MQMNIGCRAFSRACHEALSALEIPNDLLQVIQDLLLELRVHCLMVTLLHTTEGEQTGRGRFSKMQYLFSSSVFWGAFFLIVPC